MPHILTGLNGIVLAVKLAKDNWIILIINQHEKKSKAVFSLLHILEDKTYGNMTFMDTDYRNMTFTDNLTNSTGQKLITQCTYLYVSFCESSGFLSERILFHILETDKGRASLRYALVCG